MVANLDDLETSMKKNDLSIKMMNGLYQEELNNQGGDNELSYDKAS